jgi:hypothetical protein
MPKTTERRGRPPKPDSDNYERFYVDLRTDVAIYTRRKAAEAGLSLSAAISDLVQRGIAFEVEGRRKSSKKR